MPEPKVDENGNVLEEPKKPKVKFDADQTEVVNALYTKARNEALAEAQKAYEKKLQDEKEAREKLAADLAAEKKRADELAVAAAAGKKPESDDKNDKNKAEADARFAEMQAQIKEMQGIMGGLKTERDQLVSQVQTAAEERRRSAKKDSFLNALKDANVTFFDPIEAYNLAEGEGLDYDKDKDRVIVKNKATGVEKLNENGEPMSVIDFVKDFAKRKNYLVKSKEQHGGTGAGEQRRVEEHVDEIPDFSKMSPEDFNKYRESVLMKPPARA